MSTPAAASTPAAQGESAAEPTASEAVAAFVEKLPKEDDADPKAGGTSSTSSTKQPDSAQARRDGSSGSDGDGKGKDGKQKWRGGAIAELVQRERAVTGAEAGLKQRESALTTREATIAEKLKPLDEAFADGKRDIAAAIGWMVKYYGVKFSEFTEAFEKGPAEDPKPDPVEVARRTAKEAVEAARAEDKKAADDATSKDIEARVGKMRTRLQEMAEGDAERWELTAISERAGEAWDLIEANFAETGEKIPLDKALDLIEGKLKQKRDAKKAAKQGTASPGAGDRTRSEAGNGKRDGQAGEPSFSNRNTSGGGVVVNEDDLAELSEHEAVARAAKRAGIRL